MRSPIPRAPRPGFGSAGAPGYLWVLVGLLVAIELVLTAAEAGLVGQPGLRVGAFMLGAFWPPLLVPGAEGLYPGQRFVMFLSHAFLHGSLGHVAMNGVILLALGKALGERAGAVRTLALFALSAIAGAAAFALLSSASGPMIGASGAAFGFFGLWNAWDFTARLRAGLPLRPVLATVAGLVLINVALWLFLGGGLAWQAHLGGYLTGWAAAFTFARLSPRAAV